MQNKDFNKFKLDPKTVTNVKTLKEIIDSQPLIIQAQVTQKKMSLYNKKFKKGDVICMSLGMYEILSKDRAGNRYFRPVRKPIPFKRYRGQDLTNKKLLISRTGGVGDILFLQPIVKYLKQMYPTCKIIFASGERFSKIFKSFPTNLIDRVITVPYSIHEIYKSDYQLILEGCIERCEEAKIMNCYDIMSTVANVEANPLTDPLELIPDLSLNEDKNLPNKFIVLQWRASSPLRSLTPSIFKKICSKIIQHNYKIVIIDRPDFLHKTYDIIQKSGLPKEALTVITNSIDINHALSILSVSDGIVAVDSSYCHFGAALNKKTIGLFGPFEGKNRLGYYKNIKWVEPKDVHCPFFPCNFHKKEMCSDIIENKYVQCMNNIDIKEFKKEFEEMF